jgi:hypothetical protein
MSQDHAHETLQLLDIHAAAAPGWWPPAPGWWLLGLLALVLLLLLVRGALRRLAARRRRRAWLRTLDTLAVDFDPRESPRNYLAALNRLFRAVALNAFPGTECARLEGEQWVAFIGGLMPEGRDLEPLHALAHGPYQRAPSFNQPALQALATDWVKRHG